MRRIAALIFAAIPASPLCAQEVQAPQRYEEVRRSIQGSIKLRQAPALSIAVLERGRIVWAEGFGMADLERKRKASANTIYRLASISKPFTATAVMQLVDRKKVALDEPVNTYLEKPGVLAHRGEAKDISVRRLANHTAGLPTHWSFFYGEHRPPPRAETIRRYAFAAWRPGARTNYSNLAFGILDHVIARTSGKSYRDFLVEELLDPLGMRHTDVGVRPDKGEHAAIAYARKGRGFVPVSDYGFDHDGASALRSSALDLMKFAKLQIGEGQVGEARLLSREAAMEMRQQRGLAAGSRFGVGWGISMHKGALLLSHSGAMPGVSTTLHVFPGQQSAVAVLSNTRAGQLVNGAMRRTTAILLRIARPERLDKALTPGSPPPRPRPHATKPAGRYVGKLLHPDGPIGVELTVGPGDKVSLRLGKTAVARLAVRELRRSGLRLRFSTPFATTASFRGTPILDLELDRAPADASDGWRGVLYANGHATLRLPYWVKLELAKD